VAEDLDELTEKIGEIVGADQCDRCGNSAYKITEKVNPVHNPNNAKGFRHTFIAVCVTDPDEPVLTHGCGAEYHIGIYDEEDVSF